MKKAVLVIAAVALLGALGLYADNKSGGGGRTAAAKTGALSDGVSGAVSAPSNNDAASYKDGTFTGSAADTPYGTVQVAVVINGGKITGINFLRMPDDQGRSRDVTAFAEPQLKQNTLAAQNSNIEFVSGATDTSFGYQESLQRALDQAAQA
jgi:uncharacterized protein with FMN-binding domain